MAKVRDRDHTTLMQRGLCGYQGKAALQVMVSFIYLAVLVEAQLPDPFITMPRSVEIADSPELLELFMQAYSDETSDPGAGTAALDVSAILNGGRGALIPEASLLTRDAEGRVTAVILTTERTFRSDKPKTAFLAQLFTHPGRRRQGLARQLVAHALQARTRAATRPWP